MSAKIENIVSVSLDTACCDGCTACVEACPEIFGWNEEMEKAVLLAHAGPEECVRPAANCCHRRCIEIG